MILETGWGIRADRLARVGGTRNIHWRVASGEQRYVVRRYRPDRDRAAIDYEFTVLRWLRDRGWPVAPPLGRLHWHGGRAYALFPRLPGRGMAMANESANLGRRRGELLAALHRDLAELTGLGQRSGYERSDEFLVRRAALVIDRLPQRLGRAGQLGRQLSEYARWACDALPLAGELPLSIVHGDFLSQNILLTPQGIGGIVDFDDVRLDLRVADLAGAVRQNADSVLEGYAQAGFLSVREREAIGLVWAGWVLSYAWELSKSAELTDRVLRELRWCSAELAWATTLADRVSAA